MTRAQELLDAATPLPWVLGDDTEEVDVLRGDRPVTSHCWEDHVICHGHDYDDYGRTAVGAAELIVYAVNALPAYEAARELLLRWRDASLAEDAFVLGELTNETTDLLASLEAEA